MTMRRWFIAAALVLLAVAAAGQPPQKCPDGVAPGPSLPSAPITIYDPATSVIDTVGTSGTPVNLGRFGEALDRNQQEMDVTVTARAALCLGWPGPQWNLQSRARCP